MNGDTLRVLRAIADVTLRELGQESGVNYATINEYEKGKGKLTTEQKLKILEALERISKRKTLAHMTTVTQEQ